MDVRVCFLAGVVAVQSPVTCAALGKLAAFVLLAASVALVVRVSNLEAAQGFWYGYLCIVRRHGDCVSSG